MTRKILLASSSPDAASHVKVDQLIREVGNTLRSSKYRDHFDITIRTAATYACLRDVFLDFENECVIFQFFGHGAKAQNSLVFQTAVNGHQLMSESALVKFCRLNKSQIQCLILTSCDSFAMADALSQHVKYVITMAGPVKQKSALAFSEGFYAAITRGRTFADAFESGVINIEALGLPGYEIPQLTVNALIPEFAQQDVARRYEPALRQINAHNFAGASGLLDHNTQNDGPKEHLLRAIAIIGNQDPRFFSDQQIATIERLLIHSYHSPETQRSAAILLLAIQQNFYRANGIKPTRLPNPCELMQKATNETNPIMHDQVMRQMASTSRIMNHLPN